MARAVRGGSVGGCFHRRPVEAAIVAGSRHVGPKNDSLWFRWTVVGDEGIFFFIFFLKWRASSFTSGPVPTCPPVPSSPQAGTRCVGNAAAVLKTGAVGVRELDPPPHVLRPVTACVAGVGW